LSSWELPASGRRFVVEDPVVLEREPGTAVLGREGNTGKPGIEDRCLELAGRDRKILNGRQVRFDPSPTSLPESLYGFNAIGGCHSPTS
jgi:hypothetical protein